MKNLTMWHTRNAQGVLGVTLAMPGRHCWGESGMKARVPWLTWEVTADQHSRDIIPNPTQENDVLAVSPFGPASLNTALWLPHQAQL